VVVLEEFFVSVFEFEDTTSKVFSIFDFWEKGKKVFDVVFVGLFLKFKVSFVCLQLFNLWGVVALVFRCRGG